MAPRLLFYWVLLAKKTKKALAGEGVQRHRVRGAGAASCILEFQAPEINFSLKEKKRCAPPELSQLPLR